MIGDIKNPVKRPADPNVDRELRRMIYDAQVSGRLIVTREDGEGYFEADMSDPEQAMIVRRSINKKKSRIKKHIASIKGMEYAMENVDQMSIEDVI